MTTPDIFLSYNREDAAVAKRYADALAAAGLSVWWDTALRSGEAYDEVTETALRGAKAVVVLWSPRSVVSRWVRAEATIADRCKTRPSLPFPSVAQLHCVRWEEHINFPPTRRFCRLRASNPRTSRFCVSIR